MKTWKQLEATARDRGFTLKRYNDHTWQLDNDEVDDMARGEWWCSDPRTTSRVLRAMIEAALVELGRKR